MHGAQTAAFQAFLDLPIAPFARSGFVGEVHHRDRAVIDFLAYVPLDVISIGAVIGLFDRVIIELQIRLVIF